MSSAIETIKQIEKTYEDDYNTLSDKAKRALNRHCTFSGSEIWNDAAGCVKEAYEIMEQVIFKS